jgi:hypothetical protein
VVGVVVGAVVGVGVLHCPGGKHVGIDTGGPDVDAVGVVGVVGGALVVGLDVGGDDDGRV